MSTRQTLADAVSTVDGITGHPYYVQNVRPGTALVDRRETVHPNPFGGLVTWEVCVICPPAMHEAQKYVDDMALPLREALRDEMTVQAVRPELRNFGEAGDLPCLVITGTREEE